MAREILVVWAGRHQRDAWETLCAEYRRRIAYHVPVRELVVKVKAAETERLRAEGRELLAALPAPCWRIALDLRGESHSSESFATELAGLHERWPHPVAFLVGSDLGLDPALLERVEKRLSFGPMTLPHELARLVLYEQIYRAIAIGKGIKYHRASL